jgi:hypothetical protein
MGWLCKKLISRGVPDLKNGLGAKTLEMGRHFKKVLDAYPKMGRFVRPYHPDLQGPLDVCEMLLSSEIFYALVDEPEVIKSMLEIVTETFIRFMQAWEAIFPPQSDFGVHWQMMHRGRFMLRNDCVLNLSPAMLDEFSQPYDDRLFRELGGGRGALLRPRGPLYKIPLGNARDERRLFKPAPMQRHGNHLPEYRG